MAATAFFPKGQPLMPGSFGPEDFIDFYHDPFDALEELQDQWRSKDRGLDKLPELDLGDVDWHKYAPPRSLRTAPTVRSQVLLDIVASSIENIKTRIAEEDRQKLEEDELRVAEEDATRQARRGKEPYLPIVMVREVPKPEPAAEITADSEAPRTEETRNESQPGDSKSVLLPATIEKRRRFALRRLFQRSSEREERAERGESSASGAAREALHQTLQADLGNTRQARSQEAWAVFKHKSPRAPNPSSKAPLTFLSGKPAPAQFTECVSCLDDFPVKDCVKVACHSYCSDCFVRLITTAMENNQQWPPKCCLNPIPFKLVLKYIPEDLRAQFQEKVNETEVPVSERIYCHEAGCGVWVRPDRVLLASSQARCEQGHWTCTMCRGPAHGNDDCPHDRDLTLTNLMAEEEGWKRCYNCNALVEHGDACQHMTCRCGTQFCYVCGLRWRTCSCTMQQLADIKATAALRRAARVLREQEEAEELRQLLAQIEEFEREEERKAELLRQEQVRLEEERRQLELEERVRQESFRRREVELKYEELREALDILNDLQQVLLETSHETEAIELVAESKAKKEHLAQKQDTDRLDMSSRILSRISTKELDFNKDYASRLSHEKKIEEDYHQQLRAFWAGRKGGEAEIAQAMLPLRHRMDQNHRAWQKWKNGELEVYRTLLEDERTIREEIMYSAKQRMDDACEEAKLDMERRVQAEKKWLEVLMLERERLLGEIEVQEMEGDADSLFDPDHTDRLSVVDEAVE